MSRRAGLTSAFLDGEQLEIPADAEVSYNVGVPRATALKGLNGEGQGYKEEPQISFAEFPVRDSKTQDTKALLKTRDATLTLNLANGKTVVFRDASHAGEGNGNAVNGTIATRWESPHEADEF